LRLDEQRYVIEAKVEREVQLPDWFLDEPPLLPFAAFFLRHYWRLDTERPPGGRIPVLKVAEYAFRLGLPSDMISLFTDVILGLDRAYLDWVIEQRERQSKKRKAE
jgi:hypothetical protein